MERLCVNNKGNNMRYDSVIYTWILLLNQPSPLTQKTRAPNHCSNTLIQLNKFTHTHSQSSQKLELQSQQSLAIDSSAKYTLDSSAKYTLDLTIDKKHDNILIVKHPIIDLALRFPSNELFIAWLKVLSTFTYISNGPKIEAPLPSNYLYSIFILLQSLYTHPSLTEKKLIYNNLLQQIYDINILKNYANIHILSNLLSTLLTNLPSTIFKEKRIENLISYYDLISKQYLTNIQSDSETKKDNDKHHVDYDVANIPNDILNGLKLKIEELYLHKNNNKHNYGLMTLIFHLLKQIILCEENTKMNAESLSRIFVDLLESKIYLIKVTNMSNNPLTLTNTSMNPMFRMKYLIKTLIYNAYDIFMEGEWQIKDIVYANKCEIATINLYFQCKKLRKHKKKLSDTFMVNINRIRKNSLRKQDSEMNEKKHENDNDITIKYN